MQSLRLNTFDLGTIFYTLIRDVDPNREDILDAIEEAYVLLATDKPLYVEIVGSNLKAGSDLIIVSLEKITLNDIVPIPLDLPQKCTTITLTLETDSSVEIASRILSTKHLTHLKEILTHLEGDRRVQNMVIP